MAFRDKSRLLYGTGPAVALALTLGVSLVFLPMFASASSVKRTEEVKKEIKVGGQSIIEIRNAKGSTKVLGKNHLRSIRLVAVKKVKADDAETAAELLRELRIEVNTKKDKISIVTKYPEKRRRRKSFLGFLKSIGRSAYIDYFIEVPENLNVHVASSSGDVEVLSIEGDAVVNSASGDVVAKVVGGNVTIGLSSGDVDVDEVGGDLNAQTASGDVDITNVSGNVNASTSSGDMHIANVSGDAVLGLVSGDLKLNNCEGNVTVGSSSGDMTIHDVGGDLKASSSSGDIVLVFSPVGKHDYSLSTASGDVNVKFHASKGYGFVLDVTTASGTISGDMTIKMDKMSRRRLRGIVGNGGSSLVISTASGSVNLREIPGK
jgi:hypothetical protein